jgi:predicted amidohydrolase
MEKNKKTLTFSLLQQEIIWQDVDANLKRFGSLLNNLNNVDVVVLPEMFTTGFSMLTKNADKEKKVLYWLQDIATKKNFAIATTVMVHEDNNFFNRFYFVTPEGQYSKYDKKHLFRIAKENEYYTPGQERIIIKYRGWRICPLICYDLRFPIWSRNLEPGSKLKTPVYDVLLCTANWPEKRAAAWKTLLTARSIENLSYVVAVNRVGSDGAGLSYLGDSGIIFPDATWLLKAEDNKNSILNYTLDLESLTEYRKNFPLFEDADNFDFLPT